MFSQDCGHALGLVSVGVASVVSVVSIVSVALGLVTAMWNSMSIKTTIWNKYLLLTDIKYINKCKSPKL